MIGSEIVGFMISLAGLVGSVRTKSMCGIPGDLPLDFGPTVKALTPTWKKDSASRSQHFEADPNGVNS